MAKDIKLDPAGLKSYLEMMVSLGHTVEQVAAGVDKLTASQIAATNASGEQEESLKRQIKFLEHIRKTQADSLDLSANRRAIAQAGIADEERLLELAYKNKEIDEQAYLDGKVAAERKKEDLGYAEQAEGIAVSTAQTLTGVSNAWEDTVIGSFFKGDFSQNLEDTLAGLKKNFSAANMLGSALMKVQEATAMMVVSSDATFASVNQLTNGTGEYNDMIMDTMQNNAEWNVSMEDAGEAVSALYTDMSNFSNMTEEAQGHLVEATAQLKGLGIDAQTTAANFEILNGALGMTAEQAVKVQKDFAAMASDLGVSAGKIAKDFEANSDVFTAYGENAVKVFKEVAAAAKATGIEMNALLGITTKFDTFEGAARAAGQLNAVLGGGLLNSMDLLNASEEERIRMLIQAVSLSGKQWQSMSKFEKQAVMNAAGISDMTTANKLFGQSLSEYDAAQRKVEDNAEAQEKLAERAAAAASVMDKMRRIMEQFAIAVAPIVDAIHWMLNGFLALNDMMGGFLIPTLIGFLAVLAIVVYWSKLTAMWSTILTTKKVIEAGVTGGLAAATGVLSASQSVQAGTSTAAAGGSRLLAGGIRAIGRAATTYLPAIFALGLALMGLGLAIAGPFIAIAVLIWSLKELVIAFMEMPNAIMPALLGLIAFGAASMIALPMLALGIAMFVAILTPAIPFMQPVAIGLMYLAAAAIIFGAAAWLLGQGLVLLGEGVKGFPYAELIPLAISLAIFGVILAYAAGPFLVGAVLVGVGALLLGFGLQALAKGVKGFMGRGMMKDMMLLGGALFVFGFALMFASIPFLIGATLIAIPALLLGTGLIVLAKGIEGFTKRGMFEAMNTLTYTLITFGIGLIYAAIPFTIGAVLVGIAALLLGTGLIVLAKGIKPFARGTLYEALFLLPIALFAFGWGLFFAAIPLLFGGAMLLLGAATVTPALLLLWLGVKPWMDMDFEKMKGLGAALDEMTNGFFRTGFWLMFSGPMLLRGALFAAPALLLLALAVLPWMAMDWNQLVGLGWMLAELGAGLAIAGVALSIAGYPFLLGAVLISFGMLILNKPLRAFAETMAILAPIADTLPAIAFGLMILGWSLPGFAYGITMLGIAASLPFFSTGMGTLVSGLQAFGNALGKVSEKKAIALGHIFKGLTLFTDMGGIGKVFRELAWGVLMLAWALQELPEEKSVSLAIAADSFSGMMKVAMKVKPQAVETVKTMAAAASEYATASRLMREPEKDALVQAIKEAMGERKGKKGGKTGQDIVLEIDGNEFARAVDQAIDSRHSTSGW